MFLSLMCIQSGTSAIALDVNVTEAPYGAVGNGLVNDRAAIQMAIDDVSAHGGGTVHFPERRTFLTGGLELKSNVTLKTNYQTVLLQSPNPADYTTNPGLGKPLSVLGGGQVPWDSNIAYNYPFIYAGPGTRNVKITGNGKIKGCAAGTDPEAIFCFLVGFFKVSGFELSDITIENAHGYNVGFMTCDHGMVKGVKIYGHDYDLNDDGVTMQNCQDIRVTGCTIQTCDDVVVIWTSYQDPRGRTWWNTNDPQPTRNIEIDNNILRDGGAPDNYHGIIFFPWGGHCPDPRKIEISNIYVHDNEICTPNPISGYSPDAYTGTKIFPPAKDIRFERNILRPSYGLGNTLINLGMPITNFQSDTPDGKSASEFLNGDFENIGTCYWSERSNANPESTGARNDAADQTGNWYGFIAHLEQGDASLFQGLHLEAGEHRFQARVQSDGVPVRLFARDNAGQLLASLEFDNRDWRKRILSFSVKEPGNYRLGIERGNATKGWARIDDAVLDSI